MLTSKIESEFIYSGYKCIVTFTPVGHRCGYVELNKEHEYYRRNFNKIPVACHGGLTWSANYIPGTLDNKDKWYIGFDCNHSFDGIDLETYKIMYDKELSVLGDNERDLVCSSVVTMAHVKSEYEYKSKEYVEKELKRIVDQITGDNYEEFV